LSGSTRGEFTGSSLRLIKDVVVATSLVSLVASRAKRFGVTHRLWFFCHFDLAKLTRMTNFILWILVYVVKREQFSERCSS
jgi:hypothetical protein